MKRTIFRAVIVIIGALLIYLLAWPVPINPAAWTPPAAPELTGLYAQKSELAPIERLRVAVSAREDVQSAVQESVCTGRTPARPGACMCYNNKLRDIEE